MWRVRRDTRCVINAAVEKSEYSNTVSKKLRHWIWLREGRVHPPTFSQLVCVKIYPSVKFLSPSRSSKCVFSKTHLHEQPELLAIASTRPSHSRIRKKIEWKNYFVCPNFQQNCSHILTEYSNTDALCYQTFILSNLIFKLQGEVRLYEVGNKHLNV